MSPEFVVLVVTAATLGTSHTAIGLDHTLPFIMLGRARAWSLGKTLGITAVCGVAHVASSVVVGCVGLGLGVALGSLEWFEAARGYWVAWALVAFGGVYAATALVNLRRRTPHLHAHVRSDGSVERSHHGHAQVDQSNGAHHAAAEGTALVFGLPLRSSKLVASLFIVFLLGPCEALLPLMMAPALRGDAIAGSIIAGVFGAATLATMLALVTVGWFGMKWPWLNRLESHLDWVSGLAIASSGLAILVLGA